MVVKPTENQRLRIIIDQLIKDGKVKDLTAFARKVNTPQPNISSMLSGGRKVSNKVKQGVCSEFSISKDFIYDGVGEIYNLIQASEPPGLYVSSKSAVKETMHTISEVIESNKHYRLQIDRLLMIIEANKGQIDRMLNIVEGVSGNSGKANSRS